MLPAMPEGQIFNSDLRPTKSTSSSTTVLKMTIIRYEVQQDDTIANGNTFIGMNADQRDGVPDGMKVDDRGNVFFAACGER